jgi:hypothetical protein
MGYNYEIQNNYKILLFMLFTIDARSKDMCFIQYYMGIIFCHQV